MKFEYLLECRHCVGEHCRKYFMPCNILGYTKSGKAKIQVYGNRDWSYGRGFRTRYVDRCRLIKEAQEIEVKDAR